MSQVSTNYSNYSEYYEAFDNDPNYYRCPHCKGTGMDKWEEFECYNCFGEGYLALGALSELPDLTAPVYR